jgi:hypothetical protein
LPQSVDAFPQIGVVEQPIEPAEAMRFVLNCFLAMARREVDQLGAVVLTALESFAGCVVVSAPSPVLS